MSHPFRLRLCLGKLCLGKIWIAMGWIATGFSLALLPGPSGVPPAAAADLSPGAPAPPFELVGSDGRTHSLADYAGRQAVVLAWFPKAFTPG